MFFHGYSVDITFLLPSSSSKPTNFICGGPSFKQDFQLSHRSRYPNNLNSVGICARCFYALFLFLHLPSIYWARITRKATFLSTHIPYLNLK